MREIVAFCRSRKPARPSVAHVLDRYLWRVDRRTWAGRVSHACLAAIAAELRGIACARTAVAIHAGRVAGCDADPLIVIGARRLLGDGDGAGRADPVDAPRRALLRLTALLHDLGKATALFQEKLARALSGGAPEADVLRHEVISYLFWDALARGRDDAGVLALLADPDPDVFETAMQEAGRRAHAFVVETDGGRRCDVPVPGVGVADTGRTVVGTIAALILTHHRLSPGDRAFARPLARDYMAPTGAVPALEAFMPAGAPWRDPAWLAGVAAAARILRDSEAAEVFPLADVFGRTALILADQLGSALKEPEAVSRDGEALLANTVSASGGPLPGDGLLRHTGRVHDAVRGAWRALTVERFSYPALCRPGAPQRVVAPAADGPARFAWQAAAAREAARLSAGEPAGFFGCVIAGTGAGKTRGAPTILAGAAFADAAPARRAFRVNVALGLRTLASQSAEEYVADLGFAARDVAALIGGPEIRPERFDEAGETADAGAHEHLPDAAVHLPQAEGVPETDGAAVSDWLKSLSLDTGRGVPEVVDRWIAAGDRSGAARRLIETPVVCATVDHLMPAAAPVRARHVPAMLRALTADLILDEIDVFGEEDIAAIARLVFLVGAAGRRVLLMSATLPEDVAVRFHAAYAAGYAEHAALFGCPARVNHLVCGDTPETVRGGCGPASAGSADGFAADFQAARTAVVATLAGRPTYRRGEVLACAPSWAGVVEAVDGVIDQMHARSASEHEGLRISCGVVCLARTRHAMALATQLGDGGPGVLRKIVCLHARYPELQRRFIEHRLKRMLTRKGPEPDAGLLGELSDRGVLAEARASGCHEIQIVVVCTPVIETGNDLDFDYAVVDPTSPRAIIQLAGRVNRHRLLSIALANVAVLPWPLVSLETGRVTRPGVETPPAEATGVAAGDLSDLFPVGGPRHIGRLIPAGFFERIDARAFLGEDSGHVLIARERALRQRFLEGAPSVATYTDGTAARFLGTHALARRFRRQEGETQEVYARFDRGGLAEFVAVDRHDRGRAPRVNVGAGGLVSDCLPLFFTEDLAGIVRRYRGSAANMAPAWARGCLGTEIYGGLGEIAVRYEWGLGLIAAHAGEDPLASFGRRVGKTGA